MTPLQVMQLGNGGGFDFDQVSSSFIIKHEQTHILIDCGFGIVNKLKAISTEDNVNYLELINTVCITHTHEDHIGNLMSLIYYRYFVLGKYTTVISPDSTIRDTLRCYLEPCTTEFKSGQIIEAKMFRVVHEQQIGTIQIENLPAFHPGIKSFGYLFYVHRQSKSISISGDTKATFKLENYITTVISKEPTLNFEDALIFHDFSNWDNVSQNVHACTTDIATEYTPQFRKKLIYYHDAKPFTRQWL